MEPLQNLPHDPARRIVRALDVAKDNLLGLAYSDGAVDCLRLPFGAPMQMGKLQDSFERIRWAPSASPHRLACGLTTGIVVVWTEVVGGATSAQYTASLLRGDSGKGYEVKDVAWSPDATRLASVSVDARLRLWDPGNEAQPLVSTKVLDGWGQALAWDPVSRFLALVVNRDLLVLRSSDLAQVTKRSDFKVVCLAWSPDGQYLCAGLHNGACLIAERGALDAPGMLLEGHGGELVGVCFAPVMYPHNVLAMVGSDAFLSLWSTDETKAFKSEKLPARPVDCRFSADGASVFVLLNTGLVLSGDGRPASGTPISEDEFSRLMRRRYGEAEGAIAPSPAVLQQERAPVTRPLPPPPPPTPTKAVPRKQAETVGPDGKRRITPINANNPASSTSAASAPAAPAPVIEDCGTCKACLDKAKNGGGNALRRPCEKRKGEKKAKIVSETGATEATKKKEKAAASSAPGSAAAAAAAAAEEEEELVLSDWDLSDLEPEWRAKEANRPLLALAAYGFLAEDQRHGDAPKSYSMDTEHSLKFASAGPRDKQRKITRVSLVEVATGLVRWTLPVCGHTVAVRRCGQALVLATDSCEVYTLDFDSSAMLMPVVRVSDAIASLAVANVNGQPAWAVVSRDARLWAPGGTASGITVDVVLDAFEEGGMEPVDFERRLVLSPTGVPIVLVCNAKTLKAVALIKNMGWCTVVDPVRFAGSEFVDLSPVRTASLMSGGDAAGFVRQLTTLLLIEGLSESRVGANAQLLVPTQLATTLAHLDFTVQTCRLLQSSVEMSHWLGILCDRLVSDTANKSFALRLCSDLAKSDLGLLKQVVLPRLAKARPFASVVEEMTDLLGG